MAPEQTRAFLALHGRAVQVYDLAGAQSVASATIDFYHYSYSPVLLATAPLALTPYVPAAPIQAAITR